MSVQDMIKKSVREVIRFQRVLLKQRLQLFCAKKEIKYLQATDVCDKIHVL